MNLSGKRLAILGLLIGYALFAQLTIDIEDPKKDPKDDGPKLNVPDPTGGAINTGAMAKKGPLSDVLTFKKGDKLHGNLIKLSQGDGLTWTRPGLNGPMQIKLSNLQGVKLFKQKSIEPNGSRIFLTNDDALYGQIISMDEENVIFKTWYAGQLTIPKAMIKMILPEAKGGPVILNGPGKMSDWQQSNGSWAVKGNKLISNRSGTIGRQLNLPSKIRIQVELEWKSSYPQVYIIPYTNSIQNYYSHGYNIRIYSSYVQLYQGNSRQLGPQASFNFRTMKKAKLDIMIDKEKKNIVIFINGKKIKEWKGVNYVPTGNNLVLYGGSYTTTFNNLRISKWDGKIPDTIENKVAKEDLIKFKNGDKMSGKVISIKDNVVKLKTSFAEMPVPLKNITQMTFSAENLARARRNKEDIKAYFVGGSHVTFSLKSISDGKILASSENFGTANFNMNAFLGLAFNVYDKEQNLTGFESFIYSD